MRRGTGKKPVARDRGATATEYVGVLVVVAAVAGALVGTGVDTRIAPNSAAW